MRKLLVGFVLVLVVCVAVYVRHRHAKPPLETAYVGNRQAVVWDSSAEVREQVATLDYGDRVDIVDRFRDEVEIQAKGGVKGWISENDLISADVWQKAQALEARAAKLPVEAQGETRVLSNLHIEADRESQRLRQLNKGVPLDLFERQTVDAPAPGTPGAAPAPTRSDEDERAAVPPSSTETRKKEDWWLVRAHLPDQTAVTGWILGRFVGLNVPSPLPDYASSAGFRIAAWFELNRVSDDAGNAKPQYLVVGIRGGEGQPCDFTLLRVFTWGEQKQRYETAFVDGNLCGKLPVHVVHAGSGDTVFSFEDWSTGASSQRTYNMHQTAVRRVGKGVPAPAKRKHTHG